MYLFRCSSTGKINWFCSLSPLLTAVGTGYPWNITGNLSPFAVAEESKAVRFLLSVPDLSDNLGSLCSSIVFYGQEAKTVAFIWYWGTDSLRRAN